MVLAATNLSEPLKVFVWIDGYEETKILIGVGLWSGLFDAILGIVGFVATCKNHRKM